MSACATVFMEFRGRKAHANRPQKKTMVCPSGVQFRGALGWPIANRPQVDNLPHQAALPRRWVGQFAVSSTRTESMASGAVAGSVTLSLSPVCFIFREECLASASRYAFFTLLSTLDSSKAALGYLKIWM